MNLFCKSITDLFKIKPSYLLWFNNLVIRDVLIGVILLIGWRFDSLGCKKNAKLLLCELNAQSSVLLGLFPGYIHY
ncbi:hypothetical protein CAL7102_08340 [Dulcicalothrix desertica PCC 7102]|nr:hypothetical protein CAL7102_08340 [Dulcicalothrix desertica PCC 7102]